MLKVIFPHGGWGLGNDLIPWCKAYLLKRRLGDQARILGPAWGNNPRRYYRYFGTPRFDYQYFRCVLKVLPKIPFTEQIFRESGRESFSDACDYFIEKTQLRSRRAYAVTVTGLWGAFPGLRDARDFVISTLMTTKHTPNNLYLIAARSEAKKLSVGVHVRLGDFLRPEETEADLVEGMCNVRLPLEWYRNVMRELESQLGSNHLQYFVCSDGSHEEIALIFSGRDYVFCSELGNTDISDLIQLSKCDLLICSTSTYSAWAAFLSQAPYVWYVPTDAARMSSSAFWKFKELGMELPELGTTSAIGRGCLVDESGILPRELIDRLRGRIRERTISYYV